MVAVIFLRLLNSFQKFLSAVMALIGCLTAPNESSLLPQANDKLQILC